jgi:hypothetical protein
MDAPLPPPRSQPIDLPPVQRSNTQLLRRQLSEPDADAPSSNANLTSILIAAVALLAACVAGWVLAGTF